MNEKREFDLLVDVARLLRRYGPEAFDALANYLKRPEAADRIVAVLSASARTVRGLSLSPRSAGQGERSRSGVERLLLSLEKTEPEKAQMLATFYQKLQSKSILPSLRDLRSFVADNGLAPISAKSRDKAILPFIKDLASRPLDIVKPVVEGARETVQDRTLEGWAGVILDEKRRSKEQK